MLRRLLARLRGRRAGWPAAGRGRGGGEGGAAEITFFGGKGGVGKTTCAAAYALRRAGCLVHDPGRAGRGVLLISTDPAHSLGDLIGIRLDGYPRPVTAGLDALEIDPGQALRRYLDEVRANLRELVSPELRDVAERQVEIAGRSPGGEEAALLDEVVRLILDTGSHYDALVFDTAPTGQTLQLLALPEMMSDWTRGMLARRGEAHEAWLRRAPQDSAPEDRAARLLERRRVRVLEARRRLLDPACTRFVPVLNPDSLSLEETRRMVARLGKYGIAIDTLIVNRVLPEAAEGAFLEQRRRGEARHLAAIESAFPCLRRLRVPLAADEIRGVAALRNLGRLLDLPAKRGARPGPGPTEPRPHRPGALRGRA